MVTKTFVKKILVIPLRFIGDTVLTVPLLRNLKRHYPESSLDVLCSPVTRPLLEICPYVNEAVLEAKTLPAQFKQLLKGKYDLVFILRKSFTAAFLCRLAGIQTLVGFDKQRFPHPVGYRRWGVGLDTMARYPSLTTQVHQVKSILSQLEVAHIPVKDDFLELWSTPEDEHKIDSLLQQTFFRPEQQKFVALHASSASHGKFFPLEVWIPALQHLHRQGMSVIATGAHTDRGFYEELATLSQVPLCNWAGQTSLRQTFALYKRMQLMLTVDSGPMHLAAAAGLPNIVALFGPTNQNQWAPYSVQSSYRPVYLDMPCRPCYAKVCAHNNCRMLLPPELLLKEVASVTGSR